MEYSKNYSTFHEQDFETNMEENNNKNYKSDYENLR